VFSKAAAIITSDFAMSPSRDVASHVTSSSSGVSAAGSRCQFAEQVVVDGARDRVQLGDDVTDDVIICGELVVVG